MVIFVLLFFLCFVLYLCHKPCAIRHQEIACLKMLQKEKRSKTSCSFYMRNRPNLVLFLGALQAVSKARPSVRRVSCVVKLLKGEFGNEHDQQLRFVMAYLRCNDTVIPETRAGVVARPFVVVFVL